MTLNRVSQTQQTQQVGLTGNKSETPENNSILGVFKSLLSLLPFQSKASATDATGNLNSNFYLSSPEKTTLSEKEINTLKSFKGDPLKDLVLTENGTIEKKGSDVQGTPLGKLNQSNKNLVKAKTHSFVLKLANSHKEERELDKDKADIVMNVLPKLGKDLFDADKALSGKELKNLREGLSPELKQKRELRNEFKTFLNGKKDGEGFFSKIEVSETENIDVKEFLSGLSETTSHEEFFNGLNGLYNNNLKMTKGQKLQLTAELENRYADVRLEYLYEKVSFRNQVTGEGTQLTDKGATGTQLAFVLGSKEKKIKGVIKPKDNALPIITIIKNFFKRSGGGQLFYLKQDKQVNAEALASQIQHSVIENKGKAPDAILIGKGKNQKVFMETMYKRGGEDGTNNIKEVRSSRKAHSDLLKAQSNWNKAEEKVNKMGLEKYLTNPDGKRQLLDGPQLKRNKIKAEKSSKKDPFSKDLYIKSQAAKADYEAAQKQFTHEGHCAFANMAGLNFDMGNLDPNDENWNVLMNEEGKIIDVVPIDRANSLPRELPKAINILGVKKIMPPGGSKMQLYAEEPIADEPVPEEILEKWKEFDVDAQKAMVNSLLRDSNNKALLGDKKVLQGLLDRMAVKQYLASREDPKLTLVELSEHMNPDKLKETLAEIPPEKKLKAANFLK